MPVDRFFSEKRLQTGSDVVLSSQEHHHLVHVMRGRVGDVVEVVDGLGNLATGVVAKITKKEVLLDIQTVTSAKKPERDIILAQGLPRAAHLDFIVEKGTELGMTHLWLFPGGRSDKKDIPETILERARALSRAAMKQCGRLFLPEIVAMPQVRRWQTVPGKGFFGDLRPEAVPLAKVLPREEESCLIAIGPEGGFSDEEVAAMEALGLQGVKLHENVLRTETAAIVALAVVTAR